MSILPYLHNDDPASVGVGVSSWRDDDQQASHAVTCYRGGSLIEVRAVKDDPGSKALQRAGALRKVLRETTKKRELKSGSTRGKVLGFSAKARRRLHLLLGKIDAGAACLFVTLTVPDTVPHDGRSMKLYLKRFKIRLAREFPASSLLWRLECKERKSGALQGKVAGHFHGLLWGVPDQPGLRQWVAENWSASVGDQARTQVEVPRSSRAVQAYASKLYVAKDGDQGDQIEDVGRFWGIMGADLIPWAVAVVRRVTRSEAVKVLRALRRWVKADRRKHGRRGKVPYLQQWRGFFVPDAGWWADRLGGLVGASDDPGSLLTGLRCAVTVRAL